MRKKVLFLPKPQHTAKHETCIPWQVLGWLVGKGKSAIFDQAQSRNTLRQAHTKYAYHGRYLEGLSARKGGLFATRRTVGTHCNTLTWNICTTAGTLRASRKGRRCYFRRGAECCNVWTRRRVGKQCNRHAHETCIPWQVLGGLIGEGKSAVFDKAHQGRGRDPLCGAGYGHARREPRRHVALAQHYHVACCVPHNQLPSHIHTYVYERHARTAFMHTHM